MSYIFLYKILILIGLIIGIGAIKVYANRGLKLFHFFIIIILLGSSFIAFKKVQLMEIKYKNQVLEQENNRLEAIAENKANEKLKIKTEIRDFKLEVLRGQEKWDK